MNKKREKIILEAIESLTEIKESLDIVLEEENDYHENIPENLKETENAERSFEYIELIEEVISNIEDFTYSIEGI